jgi:hypothetical protein
MPKNKTVTIKFSSEEIKEIDHIISEMNRIFKLKDSIYELNRSEYFRRLHEFFGKRNDLDKFYEKGVFNQRMLDELRKLGIIEKE